MSLSVGKSHTHILGLGLLKGVPRRLSNFESVSGSPQDNQLTSSGVTGPRFTGNKFANCSNLSLRRQLVSSDVKTKFSLSDVEWEKPNSPKAIWITIQEYHSIGKQGKGWHACKIYYMVEIRASPGVAWLTPQVIRLFNEMWMQYASSDDGDGLGQVYRFKVTKYRGEDIKVLKKEELAFHLKAVLSSCAPEAGLVTCSILPPEKTDAGLGEKSHVGFSESEDSGVSSFI